jgi:hypothetical protein
MCLDHMCQGVDPFRGPAQFGHDPARPFGGEAGGLGAQRRVLFHRHAVMQQHGGADQFGVGRRFGRGDGGGVPPDTEDVGEVVRPVGPGGAEREDQAGGEGVVGGEGCVDRHARTSWVTMRHR